jgi:polyisoprenoid-binding protein YceI
MRTISSLCLLMGLATPLPAHADSFELDAAHSRVSFRISHLGFSYTWGSFGELDGTFVLDEDPDKISFDFTVEATSIDTKNERRDKHLRNDDFVSTEVTAAEIGWTVTGNMTLHGTTRPLTVQIEKIGEGKDPWGGYRAGIHSEFTILRSDFGMDHMPDGIGDEVQIFIDIEGKRKSKK